MEKVGVAVIGGGVIGLCCAWAAAARGADVVLLEQGSIGSGASSGNAGFLVPSHYEPLASPGAFRRGVVEAIDPNGPFRLRFRPDPDWAAWLGRFGAACSRAAYERTCRVSRILLAGALEVHEFLAAGSKGAYDFRRSGLLCAFLSRTALEAGRLKALRSKVLGIPARVLGVEEIRETEPLLGQDVLGGVFYEGNASLDPGRFLEWLERQGRKSGVRVRTGAEVKDLRRDRSGMRVRTSEGEISAEQVILAAGAWVRPLAVRLGIRLPVEGGKGLSLTFSSPRASVRTPMILQDRHVAVSPGRETLRLTGLFELGRSGSILSAGKASRILRAAGGYLPFLQGMGIEDAAWWQGPRPCTPDGLPVIGRVPGAERVVVAGGHGTKGMCLGPLTGLLVSRILEGGSLGALEEALSPDRFQ